MIDQKKTSNKDEFRGSSTNRKTEENPGQSGRSDESVSDPFMFRMLTKLDSENSLYG